MTTKEAIKAINKKYHYRIIRSGTEAISRYKILKAANKYFKYHEMIMLMDMLDKIYEEREN